MPVRNATFFLDGFAKLQRWRIGGSGDAATVAFQDVFVRGSVYSNATSTGKYPRTMTLAPLDPPLGFKSLLEKVVTSDNNNVNVWQFPDRRSILAVTDDASTVSVDAESLNYQGFTEYSDSHKSAGLGTAHPLPDLRTGALMNVLGSVNLDMTVSVSPYRLNSSTTGGPLSRQPFGRVAWSFKDFSYQHSFARTSNLLVMFGYPVSINLLGFPLYIYPMTDLMKWKASRNDSVRTTRARCAGRAPAPRTAPGTRTLRRCRFRC